MRHPNLLRAIMVRSAMIPAALIGIALSGCADQQPIAPKPLRISQDRSASLDRFFLAWSQSYSASPIQTQSFSLDARQERQWSWWADAPTLAFARANPGRLYIVGDEPDQYCGAAADYAVIYHDFVVGMKAVDPTARFSPSGFSEPNYKCCPLPDDVPAQCWWDSHSIGYAQKFYDEYVRRYGSPPPVDEWRFHDFALRFWPGDLEAWYARIDQLASWSVAHGAKMVLGAWGFHGWKDEPLALYQEQMKQAMNHLLNDSRINGAVWWSYESWAGEAHYLANADGSLTGEGQTYANPMTDVPSIAGIEASANTAKVRWNNPTNAWGAEVEFWVQAPGASSFVYSKTARVPASGSTESPSVEFSGGETVKARVRYYNTYAASGWSSFSDAVATQAVQAPKKGPVICFPAKRIQGESCA